jgi:exopolysaccharide biosynthesis polyprenyl glycosylphosphotransferase
MLALVHTVTPIGAGRGSGIRSVTDHPDALPIEVIDIVAAVDDRTRDLLERKPGTRRRSLVPRALVIADLGGLTLAYLVAMISMGARTGPERFGSPRELVLFALTLPCWVVVAGLHNLYHRDEERVDHSTTDDAVGIFHLVTIGAWLLLVVSRLDGLAYVDVYRLIGFWALAICFVLLARTVARQVCRLRPAYQQNTVIVGAGDVGQLVARKFIKHPEYGINVVGFVDREPRMRRADLPEHLTILGGPERLPEIVDRLDVERVVIAFSNEPLPDLLAALRGMRSTGVQIDLVPRLFDLVGPRVDLHAIEGLAVLGLPPARPTVTARSLKRAIDIVGAIAGLIATAPLFAFIAVRIRLDSPGPVLFRQTRLGTGMKKFTTLKFRTMRVDTDPSAHEAYVRETMSAKAENHVDGLYKLDRSDAITDFGRWLRKTSLDELPQLINVLRGDMSLVGPRPCIPYETDNYAPHHLERFTMPQGLTGLWQVTARANSTYGEALEMDVAYVRGWSLGLDLRLLLRTPLQVLRQRSRTA